MLERTPSLSLSLSSPRNGIVSTSRAELMNLSSPDTTRGRETLLKQSFRLVTNDYVFIPLHTQTSLPPFWLTSLFFNIHITSHLCRPSWTLFHLVLLIWVIRASSTWNLRPSTLFSLCHKRKNDTAFCRFFLLSVLAGVKHFPFHRSPPSFLVFSFPRPSSFLSFLVPTDVTHCSFLSTIPLFLVYF